MRGLQSDGFAFADNDLAAAEAEVFDTQAQGFHEAPAAPVEEFAH